MGLLDNRWFKGPQKGPSDLISKSVTDFTAPLSRVPMLKIRSFQYEGHGGINRATNPAQVGSYASVFAPKDMASIGVLSDARNRVGF